MFLKIWAFNKNKWAKTQKGYELYTKVVGLKNYIKDYSKLSDSELQEIVIWEDYLVYAIVLNNTSKLNKEAMNYYKKICDIRENENIEPEIKKRVKIGTILSIVLLVVSIIACLNDLLKPFIVTIISPLLGFYFMIKGKEFNKTVTKIAYIINAVVFVLSILIAITIWLYI